MVENTFINRTSVNQDMYADKMSLVAGFPEGRILKVTYFSRNSAPTDIQSDVVDLNTTVKDSVHKTWTEIRNFELRVQNELAFEYDADSNKTKINSEGICFPRFVPKVGDIFLYELRQGKIGMFYVGAINRLAIGQDTCHTVTFTLQGYLTADLRDDLRKNTTEIRYFDKVKYLVGDTSLFTSEGYIQKQELTKLRRELAEDFCARYYSSEMSSFMRPDEIYDPYIVEYWNRKVNVLEVPISQRPVQLLIGVSNYRKTIFGLITDNPIKDPRNCENTVKTVTYRSTFWGANITALLGHKYIAVGNEAKSYDETLIDRKGNPILVDPTTIYYARTPREIVDKRFDETVAHERHKFCEEHFYHPDFKVHVNGRYPIHSDDELIAIWRGIHGYADDIVLNEQEQALARGYVQWYRAAYPGTYSDKELKREWLKSVGKDENTLLTEKDVVELEAYIASYRSKYSSSTTTNTLLSKEGVYPECYYPQYGSYRHVHRTHQRSNDDEDNSYALSSAFYDGVLDQMNVFEKTLYNVITGKEINPGLILELVKEYGTWGDAAAFYKIPLSMHLADRALYWLNNH